jgi:hypothetical protein
LIAFLGSLCAASGALARVHTVRPAQYLTPPDASYEASGMATAINGDSIITIADRPGAREALLYRRNANGQWIFSRSLLVSDTAAPRAMGTNRAAATWRDFDVNQ